MDEELSSTKIAHSFARAAPHTSSVSEPDPDPALRDVDVEYNLMANLAESVASQAGGAGPASNLLRDMHLEVPADWFAGNRGGNDSDSDDDAD